MALDLLIKNGTVVDGSGMPRYRADVGVRGGKIVEIGRIRAAAERVIDADGLIVAPGFIDGHTHMDAQIAWDPLGSCSCWHGVTSVVMGNCGFALAPCKPEDREWFARCLTAVEDIPTEAMMAGIDWTWETFPEYLATVDRLPKAPPVVLLGDVQDEGLLLAAIDTAAAGFFTKDTEPAEFLEGMKGSPVKVIVMTEGQTVEF